MRDPRIAVWFVNGETLYFDVHGWDEEYGFRRDPSKTEDTQFFRIGFGSIWTPIGVFPAHSVLGIYRMENISTWKPECS